MSESWSYEALRDDFEDLKQQIGAFYECPGDLHSLALHFSDSDEPLEGGYFPQCHNGALHADLAVYSAFQSDAEMVSPEMSDDQIRRLYIGVGIANVVATTRLVKFPHELKRTRHAAMLRDTFASHKPVQELFRSHIFPESELQERAEGITEPLTDKQAFAINGARYSMWLLANVFRETPDYMSIPTLEFLRDNARDYIRTAYMREAPLLTDIAVLSFNQPAQRGDRMFFQTLPNWILAAAQPMTTKELLGIHSDSWQED